MIRFSARQDLNLMREVLAENPYATPKQWAVIAEKLSNPAFMFDARRARGRKLLLNYNECIQPWSHCQFETLLEFGVHFAEVKYGISQIEIMTDLHVLFFYVIVNAEI